LVRTTHLGRLPAIEGDVPPAKFYGETESRVRGEWPDLDRVATAAGMHRLLRALAEDAPEEEASALRRAAGALSRTANDVIPSTAAELAHDAGREAAA
jgi:hypothetical protein